MAHKKGAGSTRNGRDSNSQRRGTKVSLTSLRLKSHHREAYPRKEDRGSESGDSDADDVDAIITRRK